MSTRRGIIIHPDEFTDAFTARFDGSGLNVLGIHPVGGEHAADSLTELAALLQNPDFRRRVDAFESRGIAVEYECHAASYLLPRELFASHPEYFREDADGNRTPTHNLCVSNAAALEIYSENAARLAALLRPASHRYYLWADDVCGSRCLCPSCRALTASDQNLILANAALRGIRSVDPEARAAYLAYQDAMTPPSSVSPESGIFLEFAPIDRDITRRIDDPDCAVNAREAAHVGALIDFFGSDGAQALEYWVDNSKLSGWKKPPKRMSFDASVARSDAEWYASRGFGSITSFGCYLGDDYAALYGEPPIREYGRAICGL